MNHIEKGFIGAWREGDCVIENWATAGAMIPFIVRLRDWQALNGNQKNWGLPIIADDPIGQIAKKFHGRTQQRDSRYRPDEPRQEVWFWRDEVLAIHEETKRPYPASVYE